MKIAVQSDRSTVRMVCISISTKLASVRRIATSVGTVQTSVGTISAFVPKVKTFVRWITTVYVRTITVNVRRAGLTLSNPFDVSLKGENYNNDQPFSTDIQYFQFGPVASW